jgi:ribosomal-protein-alanine N-acetyltransferase
VKILNAGCLYFVLVFAAGFALGPVRLIWLAPRVGTRTAELMEMPVMLLVTILAARWVVRRFAVPSAIGHRLGLGLIALGLLLSAEFGLVLPVRGLSLAEYLARRDPVSATAYAAMLAVVAIMPRLVSYTDRPSLGRAGRPRGSPRDGVQNRRSSMSRRPSTEPGTPGGGSVRLRPWRDDDAGELARLANDRRIWLNMRDAFPHPYHVEDAHRFIAHASAMRPVSYFAIEVDDRIAGGIGYTLHTDVERVAAEVGYWLGPAFWGRGLGTSAVRTLTALAFTERPELERLYAVPYTSNPASAGVLEKCGYRLEGILRRSVIKDGRVLDQWMYALLREEWSATSSR